MNLRRLIGFNLITGVVLGASMTGVRSSIALPATVPPLPSLTV